MTPNDTTQEPEPSRPDRSRQSSSSPSTQRDRTLINLIAIALTMIIFGAAIGYFVSLQLNPPAAAEEDSEEKKDDKKDNEEPKEKAAVRIAKIERRALEPKRQIIGRLIPVRRVTVSSEVTGQLLRVAVEEGDQVVAKETILAQVDTVWSDLTITQLEAQAEAIRAELEFSINESKRMESADTDIQLYSASQRENQAMTTAQLQANLRHNSQLQAEQRERIKRSEIVAPFTGTVIDKLAETGQSVSQGTPLCEIVSSGSIYALIHVPEDIVELLAVDDKLQVTIDSLGETFVGEVASITPSGMTASRTFPVRIRLDDQGGRLKSGLSVTVEIPVSGPIDGLAIPRDAALIRPDGTTVWVVTKADGGWLVARPAPVTITAKTPERFAIEAETASAAALLVDGAQVVIEGAERLRPEQPVRIVTLDILNEATGDDAN